MRILSAAGVLACTLAAAATPPPTSAAFDAAHDAWERGEFVTALNGFIQLLNGPAAGRFVEPIAQATGELFTTSELTDDGRAPRFSGDGSLIAYETGLETSRRTIVVRNDASRRRVADLPGVSATFSPDASAIAYLRITETDDVRRAARAIDEASLAARDRTTLAQALAWYIARDSTIVVRDLATGAERDILAPPLLKTGLAYSADGKQLYFLAAPEGSEDRTDLYAVPAAGGTPSLIVDAAGLKSAPIVDPAGEVVIYTVPARTPFRKGGSRSAEAVRSAEGARSAEASRSVSDRPPTFGIVDLKTHVVSVIAGSAPTLSGDGGTLAYVARNGSEFSLVAGPTVGVQSPVFRSAMRVDAPALSADGRRIAWQMMPDDDWEIFTASIKGAALAGVRRVTRESQHDVAPRFVGPDRLLAFVGESRDRRSFLYDIGSDAEAPPPTLPPRIRLFHNNTVRTLAPEYQWSTSPDGTRLLVCAERDGDTVSPQRGVYLVDLTARVTRSQVLERLRAQLRSETALRAAATQMFQPLAAGIRPIVSRVSAQRMYGYGKSLAGFDSRHVSQPGHRLAATFIFDTLKAFGYEPEYQWFDREDAIDGRTANVVATLRGTANPATVYVVGAHYDSVVEGPGADDDGSGIAVLLEAARVLARHPLPATVVFAAFTGEESGLLGSREFVRRAVDRRMHIAGVLNNDAFGWTNDARLDNTIRYSNARIRDVQHGAALLFSRLVTYDARYWKATDAASFFEAYGDVVGGFGSYPILGSPHYHQPSDRLEFINHELVAETAKATVASVMLLASQAH